MARIRTIKPEFFRHEGLQDLEIANPGAYPMLVFAGLWGHCDKAGRFEWKPRTLKLDILPFLEFDMEKTLMLLAEAGEIHRYEADGKTYGEVPSFVKHQRINGKEAQDPEKHPAPPKRVAGSNGEALGKHADTSRGESGNSGDENPSTQPVAATLCGATVEDGRPAIDTSNHTAFSQGSNGEATRKQQRSQEGKGREEEGKGVKPYARPSADAVGKNLSDENVSALQAACRKTFHEYQRAYAARYGSSHVDNAKVRSQIKQFVQRIGFDESPMVAAWFVQHPGAKYVSAMHGVGVLLADAEKLRTEWATGRVVTTTTARQSDRRGAMASAVNNLLAECGGEV
ncbi:MAG TPA: hypothetical protein PK400_13320 [Phycisphaerales bacterium]|nr:hypothetical protein [Phycisphaerales bacterium]